MQIINGNFILGDIKEIDIGQSVVRVTDDNGPWIEIKISTLERLLSAYKDHERRTHCTHTEYHERQTL